MNGTCPVLHMSPCCLSVHTLMHFRLTLISSGAGGAVVRCDCTLLVTSLKNMYCAIRWLGGVTFSVSASLAHDSPPHIKSNHLSFSLFLSLSLSPSPLNHPSPHRSALLDLIKVETPDLSPFKWGRSLATLSTSPPPILSFFFIRCLSLSQPPSPPPLLSFLHPLSPSLSSLFPCHPFISHPAIFSLSPCRPPPPPLLRFSSLLSSAPYCSINLSGRRSISTPWLLFFPSFPAPLFSLSSPSPCLQQDPF